MRGLTSDGRHNMRRKKDLARAALSVLGVLLTSTPSSSMINPD